MRLQRRAMGSRGSLSLGGSRGGPFHVEQPALNTAPRAPRSTPGLLCGQRLSAPGGRFTWNGPRSRPPSNERWDFCAARGSRRRGTFHVERLVRHRPRRTGRGVGYACASRIVSVQSACSRGTGSAHTARGADGESRRRPRRQGGLGARGQFHVGRASLITTASRRARGGGSCRARAPDGRRTQAVQVERAALSTAA